MRKSFVMKVALCVALVALLGASAGEAKASFFLVTSRGALGGTDTIDWSTLGPPTPFVAGVPNPVTVTSTGGLTFTVSESPGNFSRLNQGAAVGLGPWFGNFAPNDPLLYTGTAYGGGSGPMNIKSNSTELEAAGEQIMRNAFGAFVATIQALDAMGNVLATFTESGVANDNTDNSAIFIGIGTDGGSTFAALRVTTDTNDFAINNVSFRSAAPVPEPTSLTLFGVGLAGLAGYGWRRRKTVVA